MPFIIGALLCASPARADIDESAYDAGGVVTDQRERARLQASIAAEMEAEARRTAEREEVERRAREAAATRDQARPWPERLTAMRCTTCHVAGHYTNQSHTRIGWRLVVERMARLNGADIAPAERAGIAEHLANVHPASPVRRVAEYGLAPALLAALGAFGYALRSLVSRRRNRPCQ